MAIHKAAEDYLEAMLMLKEKNGYIRSIDIAELLGVTKPSVSYATKGLRESGHITMDKDVAATDACKLEHDLSEESFSAICEHVKKYVYDPKNP